MINKIKFIFLSFIFLFVATTAFACDFRISKFGKPKEDIKFNNFIPMAFPDPAGGLTILIPIEEICKEDPTLYGTSVVHLYVKEKLTQIRLERPVINDGKLMDFAMKTYGEFSLPNNISKKDWRGTYRWENDKEIIYYSSIDILEGSLEILEINSKKYQKELVKYIGEYGKWLDSAK